MRPIRETVSHLSKRFLDGPNRVQQDHSFTAHLDFVYFTKLVNISATSCNPYVAFCPVIFLRNCLPQREQSYIQA